jgi:YHYH protein/Secretion system C-terminal sorting domain
MKKLIVLFFLCPIIGHAQIISSWTLNVGGKKASYYKTTGSGMAVTYTFTNTTDSADILSVCYDANYVYVKSKGMTDYMGKYLNPGDCIAQSYLHQFPRTPSVPTTKTTSPKGGAIGLLTNGIPIFGLGNAASWTGSTNANNGSGIWNAEVGKYEGFVLDTAFGAHPQQQGAYHTHTTPYRLYKYYASTVHSPIIGFAFDGNPIYGPYGYTSALNSASGISRMKTGFSLRNITTRTTIPTYSSASPAVTSYTTASQTGPVISGTYPIGSYCEDYEWLSSNGGDLDQYNGRYCVTPEYPSGTYAYFVTVTSAGVAAFPYYIGIQYYGTPQSANFSSGTSNTVVIGSSVTCNYPTLPLSLIAFKGVNEKDKNKLIWQTADEINVSHFMVERSRDGLKFEEIGKIYAKNTTNGEQSYFFMDENPMQTNYYRLKMVDTDGAFDYSKTISIANNQSNTIRIFPSIVKDIIYIRSQNALDNATVKVSDLMGRTLIHSVINLEKGEQTTLNMATLSKGLYLISIDNNGFKTVNKIVKE